MSEYQPFVQRDYLIQSLKQLRKLAAENSVPEPLFGVCYNAQHIYWAIADERGKTKDGNVYDVLCTTAFIGWPKHSGREDYPIPLIGPADRRDGRSLKSDGTFAGAWEGEYLDLRLELIDYAIAKLESMESKYVFANLVDPAEGDDEE